MSTPRLESLAEACRRGDEGAYAELYQSLADGVYHVVSRVLKNHEDATDALQETFLTAFRRFETYRKDGSVRAWIFAIGVRVALRMRRRRRPETTLDDDSVPPPEAADEPLPDHEFRTAAQQEIDRLPERARLVFVLHTSEGLTHAEIAEALEINEGTSKSQLSYARGLLQRRLARFDA